MRVVFDAKLLMMSSNFECAIFTVDDELKGRRYAFDATWLARFAIL